MVTKPAMPITSSTLIPATLSVLESAVHAVSMAPKEVLAAIKSPIIVDDHNLGNIEISYYLSIAKTYVT